MLRLPRKLQPQRRSQISSLVAELDGKLIGFIIGDISRWEYGVPENIGRIDTIGVDPDYQRKGIAKILFREMANNLKKVGVDTIITFVTRRDWKLLKFTFLPVSHFNIYHAGLSGICVLISRDIYSLNFLTD